MDENGGRSITPRDYGSCRTKECRRAAHRSGYCRTCEARARARARSNGVSDGRRTGNQPKLTEEQVERARRMRSAFKTYAEIGTALGVNAGTVSRYLRGETKPRTGRLDWDPVA